jgi:hypothetical protein
MKKLLIAMALVILFTGCASNPSLTEAVEMTKVGFWHGLWHGIIAGFAFIGSWFNDDISLYAIYNNGGWYDFGFLIGVGAFSGGACSSRNK